MVLELKDLATENIVAILEYLRATDLVSVSEVDKTVFSRQKIQSAIKYQMENIYITMGTPLKKEGRSTSFDNTPMKVRRSLSFESPILAGRGSAHSRSNSTTDYSLIYDMGEYGCDSLYVREVKSILAALQSPQPINGKGYWVSASWMANAKKYFEALTLPELGPRKHGAKRLAKIRQRRGSDALPPWPAMNADITCSHGNLALTKGPRTKKKLVDARAWFFLRKFYPEGPQFKSTRTEECCVCAASEEEQKTTASEKREAEIRARRSSYISGSLEALALRKSGLPSQAMPQKMLNISDISEEDWLAIISTSPDSVTATPDTSPSTSARFQSERVGQPLVPGLYNLVPRQWLKSWRQFVKDPTVSALPALDCTCLLCHRHGLLVIPPHVEEFLVGMRKYLLNGLGAYEGQVVEILTAEEWDALLDSLRGISDFSVRFSLDGENISWNRGICTSCDPTDYGPGPQMHEESIAGTGAGPRSSQKSERGF
jgi:hypothetical protein